MLERRAEEIERSGGYQVKDAPSDAPHDRLWDCVKGCWTVPVPRYQAEVYLRKRVSRCSACSYTGMWPRDVKNHISRAGAVTRAHEDATADYNRERRLFVCDGCDNVFKNEDDALEHLISCSEMAEKHRDAYVENINRFSRTGQQDNNQDERIAFLERELARLRNAN